jgi:hypothetical protein
MKAFLITAFAVRVCTGALRQRTPKGYTFSRGGTSIYRWECHPGSTVEWRLAGINDGRPRFELELYNHGTGSPWDDVAGRIQTSGIVNASVLPCPHQSFLHPHLAVALQVVAGYGPVPCRDTVYEAHVTSTGPYAFVLGSPPNPKATALLTWEYIRLAWRLKMPFGLAGFVASIFFVFVLRSVSAVIDVSHSPTRKAKTSYWQEAKHVFRGKSAGMGVHWWELEELAVVLAWTSAITSDVSRFVMMTEPPKCSLPQGIEAAPLPGWTDHDGAVTFGLLVLKVGVGLLGIVSVLAASFARKRPDNGIWVILALTVGVCVLSLWYAIGFGLAPLFTLVWVLHSLLQWTREFPNKTTAGKNVQPGWQWRLLLNWN